VNFNFNIITDNIDKILLWNCPQESNPMEKLHYKIINTLGIIILVTLIYPLLSIGVHRQWSDLLSNLSIAALALPIFFNVLFNKINWSRVYLLTFSNIFVFFVSSQKNLQELQFHVLFFALGLLPFALYSSSEKFQRLLVSFISLFLFCIVSWNNYDLGWPISLQTLSWNYHTTYGLTYCIIIACTWLLIQSHEVTLAYLDEERTRLINTDKLATLGELSSSLAHELKNPLAVIISRGSLMVEKIELTGSLTKEDLDKGLAVILRTANRIEQTIKSIQALSRDSTKDNLTPIPLKVLLDDVSILLDHKIKAKEVDLRIVQYDTRWQVLGRESQLVQVLMNLISNAVDAIENLNDKWIEIEFIQNELSFIIQVKDSGAGIPLNVAEKIMSPFFTTKVTGKGTGLGLSISRRIMKDHHGDLVYIPNTGNTVFQMTFPSKALYAPLREKQAS